jgi:competence protein ComEC
MKRFRMFCLLFALIVATSVASVQSQGSKRQLEIFYVDVEGGAATLIVTPAGESILVDAGWPGFDGRDAKRIEAAMKTANISQIDHLVMTHYHVDHFGGIPELARRIKVAKFYDHGPMTSLDEDRNFAEKYAAYQAATKGQSITLTPGSEIKLKQASGAPAISLQCLSTRGEIAPNKVKAPPASAECASAEMKPEDKSDNARSVVLLLRYGGFDFLDTGDLTWNIEHKLICPRNLIGEVDLYQVAHHGLNSSNNPLLLRSIKPTVAIMNNGPRKGGSAETVKWLNELPSLKALWQVHRNVASTAEQNAPADFIANPEEQSDAAHMIHVSVDATRKIFTVTNARNKLSKSYPIN